MNASDVMVHNVITIGPQAPVSKAAKLLCENDISAVPVVMSREMSSVLSVKLT